MKQVLTLLAFFLVLGSASAQLCTPDTAINHLPGVYVLPQLYNPDTHPTIDTKPACKGEFYDMTVTLKIPDTIVFNGISLVLDSVVAKTTGAITGMPTSLTYSCNPPNCHYKAKTLGCARIYGNVDTTNTTGQKIIKFAVNAYTPAFPVPIPVTLDQLSPNSQFIIVVKEKGQCTSGTDDLHEQIASLRNVPNPFNGMTEIQVASRTTGEFQFEVFSLLGQRLHSQSVQIFEGQNAFDFNGSQLAAGTYIYRLSNRDGQVTKLFSAE